MALGANSQILPVGIIGGAPFAQGDGVFVALTQPPTVISSPSLRLNTGTPDQIEIGPSTTPHATVIGFNAVVPTGGAGNQVVIGTSATSGTDTQDDVVIGHSANAGVSNGGNGSVSIGVSAAVGGVGSNAGGGVAVGSNASANNGVALGESATCLTGQVAIGNASTATNFSIAIGGGAAARFGAGHGSGAIAVGRNANANESTDIVIGPQIGTTAGQGGNILIASGAGVAPTLTGINNVVIGSGSGTLGTGDDDYPTCTASDCLIIGGGSSSANNGCIILGRGASSTGINQVIIGGLFTPAATVYIGNGVTAVLPQNTLIVGTGGSGANVGGAQVTIAGGQGTGTGVGGSLVFQTAPGGGAGSSLNALVTAVTIDSTGLATFAFAPFFTAQTAPAATVLTLTNGPAAAAAGPPQTYLTFKSTGHTYAIPAWQVA